MVVSCLCLFCNNMLYKIHYVVVNKQNVRAYCLNHVAVPVQHVRFQFINAWVGFVLISLLICTTLARYIVYIQ